MKKQNFRHIKTIQRSRIWNNLYSHLQYRVEVNIINWIWQQIRSIPEDMVKHEFWDQIRNKIIYNIENENENSKI